MVNLGNPLKDPNAKGDAFKTLFISRLVKFKRNISYSHSRLMRKLSERNLRCMGLSGDSRSLLIRRLGKLGDMGLLNMIMKGISNVIA